MLSSNQLTDVSFLLSLFELLTSVRLLIPKVDRICSNAVGSGCSKLLSDSAIFNSLELVLLCPLHVIPPFLVTFNLLLCLFLVVFLSVAVLNVSAQLVHFGKTRSSTEQRIILLLVIKGTEWLLPTLTGYPILHSAVLSGTVILLQLK